MPLPECYTGKILRVDLSADRHEYIDTETYARRFLGGRGIATAIYWDEVLPETGALDPENRLIFALGPLAGVKSGIGGSRWGIFAKSPFPKREHFCYGNLGGFFGAELKFAGCDGLVVLGRAAGPVVLYIDDDNVEVKPAGELWGTSTVGTIEHLRERGWKSAVIGPAGENLVPLATVFADGDASCSGGMGAVMGSKNLKAVAVRGSRRDPGVADRRRLRDLQQEIKSFGRGNVKVWGLDFMAHGANTKKLPCYGCMASCLRVRYTAENGKSGKHMCQSRFFYMRHAWGYYSEENDVPFLANRICDEYGIDTWQVQLLIEWLLRCHSEGHISAEESGLPLDKAGSLEFIESLVRKTSLKEGFGEILAEGAEKAARKRGKEAYDLFSFNDPYDPRYCTVNIMLLPFETREPIQQLHEAGLVLSQWSSWAKGVEEAHISSDVMRGIGERFWGSVKAADMTTLAGKAEAAKRIQDRQFAKECMGICDWMYPVIDKPNGVDHVGDPGIECRVLSAVTGKQYSEADLYRFGERVFNLQRAVLLREGHRPKEDDYLAEEFHYRPLKYHVADPDCIVPGKNGEKISRIGTKVDVPAFERLRSEYYDLRGWDVPTGKQSLQQLADLDLGDAAEELRGRGLLREVSRGRGLPRRIGDALFFENRSRKALDGHRSGGGPPDFLSDAQPLKPGALEALMEEQRRNFGNEKIAHNFANWNKVMQYYFPDIDEYWTITFVNGAAETPRRMEGPAGKPEIHYEMNTTVLEAMTKGKVSGLQAYQQRLLKLKASFSDMMKLQSLNKV
jgi:aldehyde:ferredoxin oxidoreductase